MLDLLQRKEKAKVKKLFAHNAVYVSLQHVCKEYECRMTVFRLSPEDVFAEVIWLLDSIKEDTDGAEDMCATLWNELYCNYRDIAGSELTDEELRLAVTIVMLMVVICLNAMDAGYYAHLAEVLMQGIYDHYNPQWHDVRHTLEDHLKDTGQLMVWVRAYMDSDHFLSDEDGCLSVLTDTYGTDATALLKKLSDGSMVSDVPVNMASGNTVNLTMNIENLNNSGTINDIHDNSLVSTGEDGSMTGASPRIQIKKSTEK